MPAKIDPLYAVTRLFPEMAKRPAEPFVTLKSQGMMVPDGPCAVNRPIMVLGGALSFTVKLVMLSRYGSPIGIGVHEFICASSAPASEGAIKCDLVTTIPKLFNC